MDKHVLVVGATGLLGSEVCSRLRGEGWRVRGLVRRDSDRDKVQRLQNAGVETVTGDLKDRASLDAAVRGLSAVISTASSTLSRREGDSIDSVDRAGQLNLVDAAARAAVTRFVLVSFPPMPLEFPLQDAKRAVEQRLQSSGMTYTIVQPTIFMEVWLGPALGFDVANGTAQIFGAGDRPVNFIGVSDVARFTVAALSAPAAENTVLALGGPDTLPPIEVVREAERVTGKRLTVTHVPEQALLAQFESASDPLQKSFAALSLSMARGFAIDVQPAWQRVPLKSMRTVSQHLRGQ